MDFLTRPTSVHISAEVAGSPDTVDTLEAFDEGFKEAGLVSDEDNVVVADRGFEELVSANFRWVVLDLHCNLGSAEAFFIWVTCEGCLAEEVSAQVS